MLMNDKVQIYSYDAWGKITDNIEPSQRMIARGYIGQEHLLNFGVINLNARIYDPVVGRFLHPDNYIDAPDNTQNFNRFAYCFNNPLSFLDPTGNDGEDGSDDSGVSSGNPTAVQLPDNGTSYIWQSTFSLSSIYTTSIGPLSENGSDWFTAYYGTIYQNLTTNSTTATTGSIETGNRQIQINQNNQYQIYTNWSIVTPMVQDASQTCALTNNVTDNETVKPSSVEVSAPSAIISESSSFVSSSLISSPVTSLATPVIAGGVAYVTYKLVTAKRVEDFYGAPVYESSMFNNNSAVTLPPRGIFVGEGVRENTMKTEVFGLSTIIYPNLMTLYHERGHWYQYQMNGLVSFYKNVAIPSALYSLWHQWDFTQTREMNTWYDFESGANQLMWNHLTPNDRANYWDEYNYPIFNK